MIDPTSTEEAKVLVDVTPTGAQALRLNAKGNDVEIVAWIATRQDSLSEWIPMLEAI